MVLRVLGSTLVAGAVQAVVQGNAIANNAYNIELVVQVVAVDKEVMLLLLLLLSFLGGGGQGGFGAYCGGNAIGIIFGENTGAGEVTDCNVTTPTSPVCR